MHAGRDELRSTIEALGCYLPSAEVSTSELLARLAVDAPVDLERITGIRTRRVCGIDATGVPEDSFTLALAGARAAMANSRFAASDLDVVISASITRSRGSSFCFDPSFAMQLCTALGADRARHFDVSNACAGMLTGVLILDRMIRAGQVRCGLVVSGECITPITDTAVREINRTYDPQFASLTVGDAGAAVVLEATDGPGIDYAELNTSAAFAQLCLGMPSDQGPGMALYTDNRAMHNEDRYLLWTSRQREYLAAHGTDFATENYDYLIHHQFSGPAADFIDKIAEREFGTPMPPRLEVLDRYGNTASTSHFVVLHDAVQRGITGPGSKILLVPAASGVVAGFLSVTLGDLRIRPNSSDR